MKLQSVRIPEDRHVRFVVMTGSVSPEAMYDVFDANVMMQGFAEGYRITQPLLRKVQSFPPPNIKNVNDLVEESYNNVLDTISQLLSLPIIQAEITRLADYAADVRKLIGELQEFKHGINADIHHIEGELRKAMDNSAKSRSTIEQLADYKRAESTFQNELDQKRGTLYYMSVKYQNSVGVHWQQIIDDLESVIYQVESERDSLQMWLEGIEKELPQLQQQLWAAFGFDHILEQRLSDIENDNESLFVDPKQQPVKVKAAKK